MSTKIRRIVVNVVHTPTVELAEQGGPESDVDTPEMTAQRAAQHVYDRIAEISDERLCSLVFAERDESTE